MKTSYSDMLSNPDILNTFLEEYGDSDRIPSSVEYDPRILARQVMNQIDLYQENNPHPSVGFELNNSSNRTEYHTMTWEKSWKDYLVQVQLIGGIRVADGVNKAFTFILNVTCLKTFQIVVTKPNLTFNSLLEEITEIKRNIFRTI